MRMRNDTYTKAADSIIFDDKYVIFNPIHGDLEYRATLASIRELGQTDPILLLDGKCIDGRHRTKVAKELGIDVLCEDIPSDMGEKEIILLCNKNVTSGRDYDSAQKAIQALKLVNEFGYKAKDAALFFKVDKRLVSYAATIKGYAQEALLSSMMQSKGHKIQLDTMERPSRSLELIAKHVKAMSEDSNIVIDDTERIMWKPDAVIKTEVGKAWYYEQLDILKEDINDVKLGMLLAEMANMKYRVVGVQSETEEKETQC